MRKVLRLAFSVVLLSSFAISQLPEPGNCQMAYGALFVASCRMPCCQTKSPVSHCPFLKATTPRDFIAVSAPVLKAGLQPLHTLATTVTSEARSWSIIASRLNEIVELLFTAPAPPVRAPPSDILLLAA